MKSLTRTVPVLIALVGPCPALADTPADPEPATPTQFARIVHDAEGLPESLQMAIVTYSGRDDAGAFTVDLVSAVHIGDKAYYQGLNERFRRYETLLYELIVAGTPGAPGARMGRAGVLSASQKGMKNMLGLTYQLDEIDYAAPNFVHADFTSEMLAQSMSERGESLYVYFWRALYAAFEEVGRDPLGIRGLERMSGALAAGRGNTLKIAMAYEIVEAAHAGDLLAGPEGSAVIDARNEHAVGVLREHIDAGTRHIGIFYGTAHMPDIERRLLDELSLTRARIEWVDAWYLGDRDSPSPN